jgi:hypothetical protein
VVAIAGTQALSFKQPLSFKGADSRTSGLRLMMRAIAAAATADAFAIVSTTSVQTDAVDA